MKRCALAILLVAILLCGLFAPAAPAFAAEPTTGEITGSNVAFRSGPSGSSKVIKRLAKGTSVSILAYNVNAEWHKVTTDGKTGYVNRLYVHINLTASGNGALVGVVTNCKSEVNVRKTPSASGALLGTARLGASYQVTRRNAAEGWHEIAFDGATGYIADKYLAVNVKAGDNQLSSLSVIGGTLSPSFAPGEYGYVVVADGSEITIGATANDGVRVSVDGTGKSSVTFSMPSSGSSRTVRISVGGKIRYSVYIVRNALIVGTWNIKRGSDKLVEQGCQIEGQQADLIGLQEVYQSKKTESVVDNLLSLRTKDLQYTSFMPTLDYAGGAQYGLGVLSRHKFRSQETYTLSSADKEPRALQKVVVSVDGKKVSFYNTHFSYDSSALRTKQFAEVLSILEKDKNEYKILVGDFNANASEYAKLKGYVTLNRSDTRFYSFDGSSISKNEIDNIIVSKNITVLNVRMLTGGYSDHKALYAYLRLD